MIQALFNNAQYQTLRALMDASMARHTALAGNVANVNTPGYQRRDLNPAFQQALDHAVQNSDVPTLQKLIPKIDIDAVSPSTRLDGNNVNLEREMVELTKNSAQYEVATTLLAKKYQGLRLAITGRA